MLDFFFITKYKNVSELYEFPSLWTPSEVIQTYFQKDGDQFTGVLFTELPTSGQDGPLHGEM